MVEAHGYTITMETFTLSRDSVERAVRLWQEWKEKNGKEI